MPAIFLHPNFKEDSYVKIEPVEITCHLNMHGTLIKMPQCTKVDQYNLKLISLEERFDEVPWVQQR
jgi:hypothetical protein